MAPSLLDQPANGPPLSKFAANGTAETAPDAPRPLDASRLKCTYAEKLKPVPEFNSAEHFAGRSTTDHSEFGNAGCG